MGAHRDRHQRSDLDIDQLFAPEPESRAAAPALIFTQPADRNLQLFPDEPVDFAEERILVPDQSIEPVAQPYRPRWKRSAAARRRGPPRVRRIIGSRGRPRNRSRRHGAEWRWRRRWRDWLARPARGPTGSSPRDVLQKLRPQRLHQPAAAPSGAEPFGLIRPTRDAPRSVARVPAAKRRRAAHAEGSASGRRDVRCMPPRSRRPRTCPLR